MLNEESMIPKTYRRLTQAVRQFPLDLALVALAAVLLGVFVALDIEPGWGVRTALVLLVLLLVPGYLLVAIAYPRNDRHAGDRTRPSMGERAVLAFGTSVVLLPLLALVPGLLGLSYTPGVFLLLLEVLFVVGGGAAAYRRAGVPESERFRLPVEEWLLGAAEWVRHADRSRRAARAAVVASVLLAAVSFGYVLAAPQDGEQYSTMTLLSENETGDLVAAGYPTELTTSEASDLTLAVTNDRREVTTYSVVLRLERVEERDGTQQIAEVERLAVYQQEVEPGDTWTHQHTVSPSMTGTNLRLRYYLYVDEPPTAIGPETARDYLHLWVDVAES